MLEIGLRMTIMMGRVRPDAVRGFDPERRELSAHRSKFPAKGAMLEGSEEGIQLLQVGHLRFFR
jgi:hypothetical protein